MIHISMNGFDKLLHVMEVQLKRLGDENPKGNAKAFLSVMNRKFGKRRYTSTEFDEGYYSFVNDPYNPEVNGKCDGVVSCDWEINEWFRSHLCIYKPPVVTTYIMEKRDRNAERETYLQYELLCGANRQ